MPVSLRITCEDPAKSSRLIRVDEGTNLAQLRTILIDRKLMQQTDAFVVSDSIVDEETEFQISDLPAPTSPETVKTVKLRSGQKPAQALTVQSDKDDQDSHPVRVEDPAALMLSGLRVTLGSWLDAKDRFLTKQKAVINSNDEGRWPVSEVADNGIVRVRKAAPQALVALTVQSDKDEQDSRPVRIEDPKALMLSDLRATLGSWLDAKDRFLTKQKAVINGSDEGRWPASDVADNGIVRVRKAEPQALVALTVQSEDERDTYPVRIEYPKTLMLSGLRATLGRWLDAKDRFLTKQKAVINGNDEGRWPVSEVADNSIVRVRKAAWSR